MSQHLYDKITKLEEELALYKTSDLELAKKVNHAYLANYLVSLKWEDRGDMFNRKVLTFQWFERTPLRTTLLGQIDIPFNLDFRDYDTSIIRAAHELSKFLNQEPKQVLVNLVLNSKCTSFDSK
jgi:hypothetical protein